MDRKDFLCDNLFIYWRIHPTKELDAFWEKYLLENEEFREPFDQAIEAFETIRNEPDMHLIGETHAQQTLLTEINKRKQKNLRIIYVSSVASLLLLAILSALFVLHRKTERPEFGISSIGETMNNNSIQLFTGNDMLEIDNNSTLNLSEKRHSAVIHNPLTEREIDLIDNHPIKLIVPYGKRSTLILSDGSKVYLNSGTKMEFPAQFSEKKREINIEGEIFIEVEKQNNIPFVVHTPHSQITVYGTSFNLSSYAEDKNETVVLVNGSVEVKSQKRSVLLQPSEMAEVENGIIRREQVDVSNYIAWTNGYLQLSKTPLSEVLKRIGRYYNIEFRYDRNKIKLHDQTCSGKLFLSDNFEDVLEAFSKMTYLQYDKQNAGTVHIR